MISGGIFISIHTSTTTVVPYSTNMLLIGYIPVLFYKSHVENASKKVHMQGLLMGCGMHGMLLGMYSMLLIAHPLTQTYEHLSNRNARKFINSNTSNYLSH